MRVNFVRKVLEHLIQQKKLQLTSAILVVCGGRSERALFEAMGFTNVVISNLDVRMSANQFHPFDWSYQDAQSLTYDDKAFDWVFVSDGLHHCALPHKALTEMYRVAKQGVIVFESRDSLLMRMANKVGLSPEYELEAVIDHDFAFGGYNNTHIPNYIYRWTERDFEKTVKSFDPTGKIAFQYEYGISLPYGQAELKKTNFKYITLKMIAPFVHLFTKVFKRQCNLFCMIAMKPDVNQDLWPWLLLEDDQIAFNRAYAEEHFKVGSVA